MRVVTMSEDMKERMKESIVSVSRRTESMVWLRDISVKRRRKDRLIHSILYVDWTVHFYWTVSVKTRGEVNSFGNLNENGNKGREQNTRQRAVFLLISR